MKPNDENEKGISTDSIGGDNRTSFNPPADTMRKVLLAHSIDEETEVTMVRSLAPVCTTSKRHCPGCARARSRGPCVGTLCFSPRLLIQ